MGFDITSPANDRIKWLIRLRDRRHRDTEGVFVVEGDRLYERAVASGLKPTVTFVSDPSRATPGDTVTVDPAALDRASYRSRSQGLIGVFPQFPTDLGQIVDVANPLMLVADSIEKPGNLGAMLRTAGAAGVTAVVAIGASVDPFNPNVVRSSTGALFRVPLAVSSWDELGPWTGEREIRIVAGSPDGEKPLWETDLSKGVAVVVGAEDVGLSDEALENADELVSIPQRTVEVDSLNVSVAAGILLFEAVRQRTA
ncbi:MAG: RNA methyltransferase [Acidimicrobiia bacterium]